MFYSDCPGPRRMTVESVHVTGLLNTNDETQLWVYVTLTPRSSRATTESLRREGGHGHPFTHERAVVVELSQTRGPDGSYRLRWVEELKGLPIGIGLEDLDRQ